MPENRGCGCGFGFGDDCIWIIIVLILICCCCGGNVKKTERAEKDKKKLVNRLSRIEGQIRGIKKMIENDAYCNDVLIQSAAVGAAINAFNRELLSNHIHSCVVRDIREGKDEVVDELMVTLQKLIK